MPPFHDAAVPSGLARSAKIRRWRYLTSWNVVSPVARDRDDTRGTSAVPSFSTSISVGHEARESRSRKWRTGDDQEHPRCDLAHHAIAGGEQTDRRVGSARTSDDRWHEWSRGGQILILNGGRRRGRHRRRRHPLGCACGLGRAPVSAKGWYPRHVWMAPWTARFFHAPVCRINCDHVSGLSSRHGAAGPDGIRGPGSDHALGVAMPHGEEQVSPSPSVDRHCHHAFSPSHLRRPHAPPERAAGVWGGVAIAQPSGCKMRGGGTWPVCFPANHHRPNDPCHLIGHRHGGQFLWFGPQQLRPPCIGRAVLPAQAHAVAPLTSRRRRYPLPRLLIGPSFTLPPVPSCRGTRR